MDLLEDTLKMLRETSTPYTEISTKAEVSLRWLYRFADEDFNEFGVLKVQRVYDVLSEMKNK